MLCGARGRAAPVAERSPWPSGARRRVARTILPSGAHARVGYMPEWRPWPNGAYGREKPMAERSPSLDGARGRVAYMVERLAWPSDLCSQAVSTADRVQKLDECCAQLCRSYAFPGIQQVCAEHSTSFCALLLGMGRDMSRLAAGAVLVAGLLPGVASQAAHNRRGARYRLGLPRPRCRHQPALHRQCERLWG